MHFGRVPGFFCLFGFAAVALAQPQTDGAARALHQFEAGIEQQRAGHLREAVALLTAAIDSQRLEGDNRIRAIFDRGVAYDGLGNISSAIADYSLALRFAPSFAAALNNRANAYRRQGRLGEAWQDYSAALASPGVVKQYPYYGLGALAASKGNREDARKYFKLALVEDPKFSLALDGLAALDRGSHTTSFAAGFKSSERLQLRPAISDMVGGRNISGMAGAAPAGRRSFKVQLGAFRNEGAAKAGWSQIATASDGVLAGLNPYIVTVTLPGKGQFWRLRTEVASMQAARKLCVKLADRGLPCLLVSD